MEQDIKTYPGGISSSNTAKQLGWTENVWRIFGCMRPVLTLIGKSHILDSNEKKHTDGGWEIPFEIISGISWHLTFNIFITPHCYF